MAYSGTSGTVDLTVGSETFCTWYRILGDLKSGVRPLILIHGGPGIPHDVLTNHDILHKLRGIPLVWYDQIGCGSSIHLPDKPRNFWTDSLFMDELENLVNKLGVSQDFDLLGHSWGGQLASQWASTRHPPGLKALVIVSRLDRGLTRRLESYSKEASSSRDHPGSGV